MFKEEISKTISTARLSEQHLNNKQYTLTRRYSSDKARATNLGEHLLGCVADALVRVFGA